MYWTVRYRVLHPYKTHTGVFCCSQLISFVCTVCLRLPVALTFSMNTKSKQEQSGTAKNPQPGLGLQNRPTDLWTTRHLHTDVNSGVEGDSSDPRSVCVYKQPSSFIAPWAVKRLALKLIICCIRKTTLSPPPPLQLPKSFKTKDKTQERVRSKGYGSGRPHHMNKQPKGK